MGITRDRVRGLPVRLLPARPSGAHCVTRLAGARVLLRSVVADDVDALVRIRSTPAIRARWRGNDLEREIADDLASEELHVLAIEDENGTVIGAIQWQEETEPDYRHASIDIYVDPAVHRRGYGTDAVRTLARHLLDDLGHHRLTIDPAADNHAAIACYQRVGFRPVGVMRRYERGAHGEWHDGLLMDMLATDLQN